jgi:hypothetical protein
VVENENGVVGTAYKKAGCHLTQNHKFFGYQRAKYQSRKDPKHKIVLEVLVNSLYPVWIGTKK